LFWEDVDQNLKQFESKIDLISQPTDLIVLPEMFTTGFTMDPKAYAESHEGKGLNWMQLIAKDKNTALVGSISIKDRDKFYNRLYWVFPDGSYKYYDKKHLFSMGNENKKYHAGNSRIIIDYKGWKICPLICYDLRFPVWSRNTKKNSYDILIYIANWPAVRAHPWKQLLIARAIENQCFVIGLNRVGKDINKIEHSGDSMVINAKGEIINQIKINEETEQTTTINKAELIDFRNTFSVLNDADDFTI
jgi:predicted amidohydrolase